MLLCYIEERFYFLNLRGKITTFLRDMQVFEHESAELVDFDGEMSKKMNIRRESERELAGLAASTKPSKASGSKSRCPNIILDPRVRLLRTQETKSADNIRGNGRRW